MSLTASVILLGVTSFHMITLLLQLVRYPKILMHSHWNMEKKRQAIIFTPSVDNWTLFTYKI
jgi:hypothetical protein